MNWQQQLAEIVDRAQRVPTFQEWLTNTGYAVIPKLTGVLDMRSVIRALYREYLQEYGKAA